MYLEHLLLHFIPLYCGCKVLGYNICKQSSLICNCSFLDASVILEFGGGSGKIFLDEVKCSGQEERLEHCSHNGTGVHNCGHSEDVGVVCDLGII